MTALKKKNILFLICMIILACTACGRYKNVEKETTSNEHPEFQITFYDTGKSDCILMELGDTIVMNDTADEDDYEKIQDSLNQKGIDTIDYLIISHFDKDHIGSAAQLIKNNQVKCVLLPDYQKDSNCYQNMMSTIERKHIKMEVLKDHYEIKMDKGVVTVNAPHLLEYNDENNYSLIVTLTYKDVALLFMGDALNERTNEFLEDSILFSNCFDLIKMPHHGDYYKGLKILVEDVGAFTAIITDDETRKRTQDKLLEKLDEHACQTFFTSDGDIVVTTNGNKLNVMQQGE